MNEVSDKRPSSGCILRSWSFNNNRSLHLKDDCANNIVWKRCVSMQVRTDQDFSWISQYVFGQILGLWRLDGHKLVLYRSRKICTMEQVIEAFTRDSKSLPLKVFCLQATNHDSEKLRAAIKSDSTIRRQLPEWLQLNVYHSLPMRHLSFRLYTQFFYCRSLVFALTLRHYRNRSISTNTYWDTVPLQFGTVSVAKRQIFSTSNYAGRRILCSSIRTVVLYFLFNHPLHHTLRSFI